MSTSSGRDYRVLIVEDDRTVAKALKALLSKSFEVEVAHCIADGFLRLADQDQPPVHAILLDLILPNGAGKDVVVRFRKGFPHIPIVIVSGAKDIQPEDVIRAGAHDFIAKPPDIEEVCHKLTYAIARHQSWEIVQPVRKQVESMKRDLEKHEQRLDLAQEKTPRM